MSIGIRIPTRPPTPYHGAQVRRLALSLYANDEEVKAFAKLKAEAPGNLSEAPGGADRIARVLRVAWQRDENGWRTKFTAQAEATAKTLAGPWGPQP